MIISVAPPFCQKMQPQSCGILKLGSAVHVVIVNCVETCQARSLRWVTCVLATNRLDSTCVATMMSSSSRLRRWTIRLIFSSCFCSQVSQWGKKKRHLPHLRQYPSLLKSDEHLVCCHSLVRLLRIRQAGISRLVMAWSRIDSYKPNVGLPSTAFLGMVLDLIADLSGPAE